mmetsp:Transcript_21531/g.61603  ORF Transcript_21531/g.61603 Transcript_21531/m.61603 type:complete len:801 (+) Transcript_21531:227-2629(+)
MLCCGAQCDTDEPAMASDAVGEGITVEAVSQLGMQEQGFGAEAWNQHEVAVQKSFTSRRGAGQMSTREDMDEAATGEMGAVDGTTVRSKFKNKDVGRLSFAADPALLKYDSSPKDWVKLPDEALSWDPLRKMCCMFLLFPGGENSYFDTVMGAVIVFNVFIMIMETDETAACPLPTEESDKCVSHWIVISNYILLGFYTLEVALRLYVERRKFIRSRWNLLDSIIVFCGLVGVILQDVNEFKRVNILRLLRVARVIRVAKILKRFPTLMSMIGGFVGAMLAMWWGLVLIIILLVMWSLLTVELVYPAVKTLQAQGVPPFNDPEDYCNVAFSTVTRSTFTFFQNLVAGDSWGYCARPIVDEEWITFAVFAGSLVTVQLGFTNLVLAVIVDAANEARDHNKEEERKKEAEKEAASFALWYEVMRSLDADNSGSISADELLMGYQNDTVKDTLSRLHITETDLMELFRLMDTDGSGQLGYTEFVESFHRAQNQDARMYMMFMSLRIQRMEVQFREEMKNEFAELKKLARSSPTWVGQSTPKSLSPKSPATRTLEPEMRFHAAPPTPRLPQSPTTVSGVVAEDDLDAADIAEEQGTNVPERTSCVRASRTFQHDARHAAAPAPPTAAAFSPVAGGAVEGRGSQPAAAMVGDGYGAMAQEFREMRRSLEQRLDALAAEAAGSSERLARQGALLEALHSTTPPPPPAKGPEHRPRRPAPMNTPKVSGDGSPEVGCGSRASSASPSGGAHCGHSPSVWSTSRMDEAAAVAAVGEALPDSGEQLRSSGGGSRGGSRFLNFGAAGRPRR